MKSVQEEGGTMPDRHEMGQMRRVLPVLGASLLLGLAVARCGAENVSAPDLDPKDRPQPSTCKSVQEYMPEFFKLLREPNTPLAGLREVVTKLSTGEAAGGNPIAALLDGIVRGLTAFTHDPPENDDGQCLTNPPPLLLCAVEAAAGTACENRTCAVRRALDFGVKQESAKAALDALQPVLGKVLGYIANKGPGSDGKEHYEGIDVLHRTATEESLCSPANLIDVLDGAVVYFRANAACGKACAGYKALGAIKALVNDPALQSFLQTYEDAEQTASGRSAFQKLAKVLGGSLAAMPEDERYFNDIQGLVDQIESFLDKNPDKYGQLKSELDDAVAVVKGFLDPQRAGAVLRPLKGVVNCVNKVDADGELVGVFYDLLSKPGDASGQGLDLKEVVTAVDRLAQLDENGVLFGAIHTVLVSTRHDEASMDALRQFLQQVLTVDNAKATMPALQAMVDKGVLNEILTLLDNLLYGCKSDQTN
jgi:hypothetical protein